MTVVEAPKNLLDKNVDNAFFNKTNELVNSGHDVVIDFSGVKVGNKKVFDQLDVLKNSADKSNVEFNLYGMSSSMKELVEMIGKSNLLELTLDRLPSSDSDFNTSFTKSSDVTPFNKSNANLNKSGPQV